MLVLMMLGYGIVPTSRVVWAGCRLLLLAFTTTLAVGLWLSALNVSTATCATPCRSSSQFWLFATPIAYPSSLWTPPWRAFYALNPMVGVVEGFRWALLGSRLPLGPLLTTSSLAASRAAGQRTRTTSGVWRRASPTWSESQVSDNRGDA